MASDIKFDTGSTDGFIQSLERKIKKLKKKNKKLKRVISDLYFEIAAMECIQRIDENERQKNSDKI